MEKRIGLLFDCLMVPYNAVHVIHVALAVGNCDLYIFGNSIDLKHKKIVSKVNSRDINSYPHIEVFESLYIAAQELHNYGRYLIGTLPHAKKSISDLNLSESKSVFVFGTESGG